MTCSALGWSLAVYRACCSLRKLKEGDEKYVMPDYETASLVGKFGTGILDMEYKIVRIMAEKAAIEAEYEHYMIESANRG